MKIGIVCYPTFGGSGVLATELGIALADRNHEIHFITYQQPVRLSKSFHPNIFFHEVGIPTYPLFEFPPYESALAGTLVSVIENYQLDILHVHYAVPHASAAYYAQQILKSRGKDIPFITTLHGTDITLVGKDGMYSSVVTYSIDQSNAVTAVSENLKEATYKNFPVKNDIHVIYNFVDTNRFSINKKDHFKKMLAPNDEKILVHVSNFRKVKRVQDVIAVFEKVRAKMPCKLLMVGDGPERPNLEEQLRCKSGNCTDVRFLGKQEQMEEIYNISDLFILPSEYESFGLAALEAMACGVPVISSNAGGLPEINIPGVTGFMSNIGDTEDMAENALTILSNEDTLAQFKTNAHQYALKFSIENIIPEYEALYKSTIKQYSLAKQSLATI